MGKGKSPKVNETQGFLTQQNDRELYPCPRIILHDTALKKKVSTSRCPTYNIISDPQSSVLDVAPRLGLRNVLPLLLLLPLSVFVRSFSFFLRGREGNEPTANVKTGTTTTTTTGRSRAEAEADRPCMAAAAAAEAARRISGGGRRGHGRGRRTN